MINTAQPKPIVLCIGGFDPSGCAGLIADIQTVTALGGHPMSICSCQTVQNAHQMQHLTPISAELFIEQLAFLEKAHDFNAIKIGALGNAAIIDPLIKFTERHSNIPVIIDPVLSASQGASFFETQAELALLTRLIGQCFLATPNSPELKKLTADTDAPEDQLLSTGLKHLVVTGGHDQDRLVNRLYNAQGLIHQWVIQRYPGEYRGTGCLFSSAISTFIAQGMSLIEAIEHAQSYTAKCIMKAFPLSNKQVPDRR